LDHLLDLQRADPKTLQAVARHLQCKFPFAQDDLVDPARQEKLAFVVAMGPNHDV